jgi:hypothetical protein
MQIYCGSRIHIENNESLKRLWPDYRVFKDSARIDLISTRLDFIFSPAEWQSYFSSSLTSKLCEKDLKSMLGLTASEEQVERLLQFFEFKKELCALYFPYFESLRPLTKEDAEHSEVANILANLGLLSIIGCISHEEAAENDDLLNLLREKSVFFFSNAPTDHPYQFLKTLHDIYFRLSKQEKSANSAIVDGILKIQHEFLYLQSISIKEDSEATREIKEIKRVLQPHASVSLVFSGGEM